MTAPKNRPIFDTVTTENFNNFILNRCSVFTDYLRIDIPNSEENNEAIFTLIIKKSHL